MQICCGTIGDLLDTNQTFFPPNACLSLATCICGFFPLHCASFSGEVLSQHSEDYLTILKLGFFCDAFGKLNSF